MKNVDENYRDVAKGMGMTNLQSIFSVELPIAMPTIMAGIRLAAVYVIAWATLASYIGAGGLGDMIFSGLNNYQPELIFGGTIPGLASTSDDNTVAITGGITSEAQILGSIVADMVEHYTDKKTNVINNLATTTINHQAMLNGDASISAARYTGTDVTTTLGLPAEKDPKKAFNLVQSEFEKRYQQTWFPSYGFENTYKRNG